MRAIFFTITALLLFSCSTDSDNKLIEEPQMPKTEIEAPKEKDDSTEKPPKEKDKDKEKEKATDKELLLGTWNVTKVYSINGELTGVYKKVPISLHLKITGKEYNMKVIFEESKIANEGSFIAVVSVSNFLIKKTIEQKVEEFPTVNGEWDIKDNQIFAENKKIPSIKFTKITKDKTVIKIPLTKELLDEDTLAEQGLTNVNIKGNLIIKLTKE